MHDDLLRRALESKKTVSRKQRSKQNSAETSRASSRQGSAANSRAASRIGSRDNSDDEAGAGDSDDDGAFSDSTDFSLASLDGVLSTAAADAQWADELRARTANILDRARRNQDEREQDLRFFVTILRRHLATDELAGRASSLCKALLRAAKAGSTELECVLALRALQLIVLTDPDADLDPMSVAALRGLVDTLQNPAARVEAVYALGLLQFLVPDDDDDMKLLLDYLLELVAECGPVGVSSDDAPLVAAALHAWSLVASLVDDMEDESEAAVEALVDQLDSANPAVQVAAGEDVALLYEKSWTPLEHGEEPPKNADPDAAPATHAKRYEPYRRKDELLATLHAIASTSTKRVSKKNRKTLHTNFADIRQSVEDPTLGPRYSTALDEDGRTYGSRLRVSVGGRGGASLQVDTWWKLVRLRELRRVLAGGFAEHFEHNGVVSSALHDEIP